MSELGQKLKQAREAKQMTLAEMQEITKIRKSYLEAIELGEYERLPGRFYARAFVKSYAETVGIVSKEAVAEFEAESPDKSQPVTFEKKRRTVRKKKWIDVILRRSTSILLWTFALLIIVLIYNFANNNSQPGEAVPPDDSAIVEPGPASEREAVEPPIDNPEQELSAPPSNPEPISAPEISEPPQLVLLESSDNTFRYLIQNAGRLELEINFSERVWTEVFQGTQRNQGERFLYANLERNETFLIVNEGPLYVVLGFPTGAQLIINGLLIDTAGVRNTQQFILELDPS